MLFKESVAIALTALLSNKLRSILTMLGIIIGIAAVIVMISIGMGVRKILRTPLPVWAATCLSSPPTRPTPAVCVLLPAPVRS